MKKLSLSIIVTLSIIALLVLIYRLSNSAPSEGIPLNASTIMIIDDGGCLSCHTYEPTFPFYSEWPIVGKIIHKDIKEAQKQIDLTGVYQFILENKPSGEVALAKIEKAITDGSMPPLRYSMVHWGSSITNKKRDIILNWVSQHRTEKYPNPLATNEFKNEPISPIDDKIETDSNKVVLGELLFHDTRLSLDNTVSCADCHDLSTAGVDNEGFSEGVGGKLGGINAPTVFNSVYNFVQFWDGRASTLALQAAGPPLNPVEMASNSFDEIIAKLNKDKEFLTKFLKVYPDGLSEANITNAIEEFEKTLLTPNSPFDRYLKGDKNAISAQQVKGYELFKHYECATCHTGSILGGQSYEFLGLSKDYFDDRGMELTIEDNGRFKETSLERDKHRFKVPGLRNVALTWPYFHDASQPTLEDAVRAMGKYQIGVEFSKEDIDLMVSFMNSLTGEYKGKVLENKNTNDMGQNNKFAKIK
jgi:cytochrome c peroxidase